MSTDSLADSDEEMTIRGGVMGVRVVDTGVGAKLDGGVGEERVHCESL